MEFYLVRHGEAVSQSQDPARPLSPSGGRDVEEVARLASAKAVRVAAIFHSGILRAKQTAEILAAQLQPKLGARPMTGLLPEDDPMIAKAELEAAEESIMLVGHLPHMKCLAALLAGGDPDGDAAEFAPATIICFSLADSRWKIAWILSPAS